MTLGVTTKLLTELGYHAEGVTSGTDAVRRLRELPCDVVVATFGAPPMTGYGLWALLTSTPRLCDIPFVLALMSIERQRLLDEGRDMPATLEIPFTVHGLAGAIERARRGDTVEVFEL